MAPGQSIFPLSQCNLSEANRHLLDSVRRKLLEAGQSIKDMLRVVGAPERLKVPASFQETVY
jgi:hypothetical protein